MKRTTGRKADTRRRWQIVFNILFGTNPSSVEKRLLIREAGRGTTAKQIIHRLETTGVLRR
ncbi:MAG TPA: hypothetical protein VEA59_01390 [Patescibacteria group bacterium]|nr:hypothetical protein [Patescibacteria group bacterium]